MSALGLPFRDRTAAGMALAAALDGLELGPDAIVLGIPRGGVPVAAAVAERLRIPMDILVAHKIGAPFQPELAIGAVAADGTRVIDALARELLDPAELDAAVTRELERARQREAGLRGVRPAPVLAGRGVVLVDDGIAVGSTMEAAVRACRSAAVERITAAVPAASTDGAERIRRIVDQLVVVATPPWFGGVGEWYRDFGQVSDDTVRATLAALSPVAVA